MEMSPTLQYLSILLGGLTLALFLVGLYFAVQTDKGREGLAGAAVRVALAALALAERWLASQAWRREAFADEEISTARSALQEWQARR